MLSITNTHLDPTLYSLKEKAAQNTRKEERGHKKAGAHRARPPEGSARAHSTRASQNPNPNGGHKKGAQEASTKPNPHQMERGKRSTRGRQPDPAEGREHKRPAQEGGSLVKAPAPALASIRQNPIRKGPPSKTPWRARGGEES